MKLSIDPSIQRIPFYPKAALYGADGDWVRLASNENPYPPSDRVIEAIVAALSHMNRYPESEFELKSLLAEKYGLKPENIVIGNGSNEMIETAVEGPEARRPQGVLVTEPSFAFYRIAASIYGYEVASAPGDPLHPDLGACPTRSTRKPGWFSSAIPTTPRAPSSTTSIRRIPRVIAARGACRA